jgi:hypothetical protein
MRRRPGLTGWPRTGCRGVTGLDGATELPRAVAPLSGVGDTGDCSQIPRAASADQTMPERSQRNVCSWLMIVHARSGGCTGADTHDQRSQHTSCQQIIVGIRCSRGL